MIGIGLRWSGGTSHWVARTEEDGGRNASDAHVCGRQPRVSLRAGEIFVGRAVLPATVQARTHGRFNVPSGGVSFRPKA